MELIASITERTTAASDLVLAVMALGAVVLLHASGGDRRRRTIWMALFGMLAAAGITGGIVHGLNHPKAVYEAIWVPLNLLLILLVSLFAVAAIYDLWGERGARRGAPPMILVGLLVWASLYIGEGGSFLWVILYQGVVMLASLGAYLTLARRGELAGAWWMVAGLVVTIAAAGVQAAGPFTVILIWPFDHNGVFHLVQMVGVTLLVHGLRLGLSASPSATTETPER